MLNEYSDSLARLPRWHSGKKKNLPANTGNARYEGSILGLGISPGVGDGNQYCHTGDGTRSSILNW